jgi:hypothetical protein
MIRAAEDIGIVDVIRRPSSLAILQRSGRSFKLVPTKRDLDFVAVILNNLSRDHLTLNECIE